MFWEIAKTVFFQYGVTGVLILITIGLVGYIAQTRWKTVTRLLSEGETEHKEIRDHVDTELSALRREVHGMRNDFASEAQRVERESKKRDQEIQGWVRETYAKKDDLKLVRAENRQGFNDIKETIRQYVEPLQQQIKLLMEYTLRKDQND